MTLAPCKDCSDRYVGCHSSCKGYHTYKQIHEEEKEVIRQQKKLDSLSFTPYGRRRR